MGTHFYQTAPKVLEKFQNLAAAKVRPPNGALFHPKVYLFETDECAYALVGSHNLTHAALFGSNVEVSILLSGVPSDSLFRSLKEFVREEWKLAERIDDEFLFAYRQQYEAKKPAEESLKQFARLRPAKSTRRPSPLELDWTDFVRRVKGDAHHSLDGRLAVLRMASELFEHHKSFAAMPVLSRKAVAGTLGDNERGPDNLSWGWFGTMTGLGDFASMVKNRPAALSHALDEIPDEQPVTEDHFNRYCRKFNAAFRDAQHKGGPATASRLLALKRPDVFVGVNGANRVGLCDAFGTAPTTLRLDNYWERIVIPMQASPFWCSQRPSRGVTAEIWDCRAALLDSIYYDPDTKR
ncbi:hypothetical protein LZ009_09510 [Ramlibacter sp. XY19]|uniref:hypothetical protein n=1 Tax=Ramlibacter paludis TaxID=2908000 RepID=UPI0023DA3D4F|nr:hypothetical protein [Ramlibacter paludis]MCG2593017.1 hypothetical protein [Ramlibacter paludis]